MFDTNFILKTDSYKASHSKLYPPGTENLYAYVESRGGLFPSTVFFGLQILLKKFEGPVFQPYDVQDASRFFSKHGEPFDAEGWYKLYDKYRGDLPIRIKAVPEGLNVPTHNVLMTVEATDPDFYWLPSYLETQILRAIWYPTTVATLSYYCKKVIKNYLELSSDDPDGEIGFKLHDFGARGVSSAESAAIGGAAHLVNFIGSDTVEGIVLAQEVYGATGGMPAFSIPATEHSTIISWGRENEYEAYENVVRQFAKPGALFACVSDSYDLYNVLANVWCGDLGKKVAEGGATIVVRPDSGNPPEVVLKSLEILTEKIGFETNSKGYKVLPKHIRLIQGDGINLESIEEILKTITDAGFSASNVAFGMGGALLQQVNRDTQKFAYKVSDVTVNGEHHAVSKDPATDPGKQSKKGRLSLVKNLFGQYETVSGSGDNPSDILQTVFENGRITKEWTFDEVRANTKL